MAKKRVIPKTRYPLNLERSYAKQIIKLINQLENVTLDEFDKIRDRIDKERLRTDSVITDDDVAGMIKGIFKKIKGLSLGIFNEKDTEGTVSKHIKSVSSTNKNTVESQGKIRGINPVESETWLKTYVDTKVAENVSYITNVRDEYTSKAEQIVLRGVTEGQSAKEMRDQLMEQTGMSRNKAKFVARDQTGSLLGQMTAERHKKAGIRAFRWQDSGDAAVRQTHADRNGKVYYYEDDPLLPGTEYNCRCVAEPVFDDELEEAEENGEVVRPPGVIKNQSFDGTELMSKTNMKETVGDKNFTEFTDHLSNIQDNRVKDIFEKYSDQISFEKLKDGRAFASGANVQLSQESFNGGKISNPLQTVYHEIGHAFDSLGLKVVTGENRIATGNKIKKKILRKTVEFEETVSHISGMPKYKLKETIERDLWEHVNGKELPMYGDLGKKPRKKVEKVEWETKSHEIYSKSRDNFVKFGKEIIEKYGTKNEVVGALSDIYESTSLTSSSYPFGVGHGKKYYKGAGQTEAEFFAHVMESLTTNPESFELINEIFPNSVKTWENIVDDILKAGG